MAIEWSLVQSVITAASGLGGVWLGGQLTSKREEARADAHNKKESTYLAILVVAHLDRLANACLHVAFDDGTDEGRPSGTGGCYAPTVTPPTFNPLALDVNWKALPADLMYDILNMPYRIENLERHIWGIWDFDGPPEYTEFFWARQHGYAVLGLEVSDLAQRLRELAALPPAPHEPDALNRDDLLREQRDKITKQRQSYEALCKDDQENGPAN